MWLIPRTLIGLSCSHGLAQRVARLVVPPTTWWRPTTAALHRPGNLTSTHIDDLLQCQTWSTGSQRLGVGGTWCWRATLATKGVHLWNRRHRRLDRGSNAGLARRWGAEPLWRQGIKNTNRAIPAAFLSCSQACQCVRSAKEALCRARVGLGTPSDEGPWADEWVAVSPPAS